MTGETVPADPEKGIRYYRKAAEMGNGRSMMALGYAYQTGDGVDADPAEAARWYEQAALAGREDALAALASLNP
jgi:TPR repeat protein